MPSSSPLSRKSRCPVCNREKHEGRCPNYTKGVEDERDRLREALTLVVEAWDEGGELDLLAALVAARDLIAVPR